MVSEPYRILSVDGGGIKGALSIRLIERLDNDCREKHGSGLLENVDMIAETSIGGVIALGLAAGIEPARISQLFREDAEDIFRLHSPVRRLFGFRKWQAETSLFDNGPESAIRETITRILEPTGMQTLGELQTSVLIPTFDLDYQPTEDELGDPCTPEDKRVRKWRPRFFHNMGKKDLDYPIVDVALMTSAAPTFFPIYRYGKKHYVDGGVVANNPAMCAVAQVLRVENQQNMEEKTDPNPSECANAPQFRRQSPDNIQVLSIGAGIESTFISDRQVRRGPLGSFVDRGRWGAAQWGFRLLQAMIEGPNGTADFQVRLLLGDDAYQRVNPPLTGKLSSIEMHDYTQVNALMLAADTFIDEKMPLPAYDGLRALLKDWCS